MHRSRMGRLRAYLFSVYSGNGRSSYLGLVGNMLSAVSESGIQFIAEDAVWIGGDYFCPKCGASVILRNGLIKVPHFAHTTKSSCDYAGESSLHLQMKVQIFRYLQNKIGAKVHSITLEKPLGSVRPDIYLEGQKKNIAIEVQASILTPAQILYRTDKYFQKGIYVLWVLPYAQDRFMKYNSREQRNEFCAFRIKEYEKIIMQMGFRSLVLWDVDRDPCEGFRAFKIGDRFTEGVDFFDKDRGEHVSYSPRKQKSMKTIMAAKRSVQIGELTFRHLEKFSLDNTTYDLPERMIGYYNWPKSNNCPGQ